jgi:protein-L-isoaspartate(D-aspartate) O-methyltransferase
MRRQPDYEAMRAAMVERQLRRRGIRDERVLAAMATVPREEFVPERRRRRAYDDSALPIGNGQTISQPWVVATICEALAPAADHRVLEIGTGSGYSAAVLARLARAVVSVERDPQLADAARQRLGRLGVEGVEVVVADGSAGLPDRGPFDAVAVHATAPSAPRSLLASLPQGGRLVVPIAGDGADVLMLFARDGERIERTVIGPCRFVPLVGREGFAESGAENG